MLFRSVVVFRGAVADRKYRVDVNGADLGAYEEKSLAAGIPVPVPSTAKGVEAR